MDAVLLETIVAPEGDTYSWDKDTAIVSYAKEESASQEHDYWRVMQPFTFLHGGTALITIPYGFLTDGATVPRWFWSIIPPWGAYGQAAIIHDYLCRVGVVVIDGKSEVITSRAEADSVFKTAMKSAGVPRWKRNVMYIAVRIYAWFDRPKVPDTNATLDALEAKWLAANPK